MFKTQETKVFGSIRKVKHYGACGVILGMAALAMAFSTVSVSADELNANQNVPKAVQEVPKQDETAKKNTTVDVVVDHSTVDQAVAAAKKAGLKVQEDVATDAGVAESQDDLAKRKADIEKSYDTQSKNLSESATTYKSDVAKRENERTVIQNENTEKKAQYEKDLDQYNKDTEEVKNKNAQIDRDNKKKHDDYQKAKAEREEENRQIRERNRLGQEKHDQEMAAYNNRVKTDTEMYEREKARVEAENERIRLNHEKALKELQERNDQIDDRNNQSLAKYGKNKKDYEQKLEELKKKGVAATAPNITLYGNYDETKRGSLEYYGKLTAAFSGVKDLELVKGTLGATSEGNRSTKCHINGWYNSKKY